MRLEKNIINLSIEEATGFHDPVEKHANTGTPVLCTIQPSSLGDISVTSKPTPQSTRGWKRLTRGILCKGLKWVVGSGLRGKNDFGKRGMDMEIDVLIKGKNQCMEYGSQEEEKNSKVVVGSQHH